MANYQQHWYETQIEVCKRANKTTSVNLEEIWLETTVWGPVLDIKKWPWQSFVYSFGHYFMSIDKEKEKYSYNTLICTFSLLFHKPSHSGQ